MWSGSMELLVEDNCLSQMEGGQMGILPNLEAPILPAEKPNQDVQQLETEPLQTTASLQKNYVVLKEGGSQTADQSRKLPKTASNFEDMLYFVCNLCPFLCTTKAKITEHLASAHQTKTTPKLPNLKCPACANEFFYKVSLRSHLIHDHGVGNADINQIIQAVAFNASRAKPAARPPRPASPPARPPAARPPPAAPAERAPACPAAGCRVSLRADNMALHARCHRGAAFACCECGAPFAAWKPLASHLWRAHRLDMELHACDRCDYRSVSLSKLNAVHKLTHGEARAYACGECAKAFKNSKQLANHRLVHRAPADRAAHECAVCVKRFSSKRQLKQHKSVVHEKLKPFLCSYCGYKGSSRSSLKMHVRQHTGEKPFSCDSCAYKTADHNSLRRHKLRHSGQRPYKCSFCPYDCIQSSTFKTHLKTKHPGQETNHSYACQECQFRTISKEVFVTHSINAHAPHISEVSNENVCVK